MARLGTRDRGHSDHNTDTCITDQLIPKVVERYLKDRDSNSSEEFPMSSSDQPESSSSSTGREIEVLGHRRQLTALECSTSESD